MRILAIIFLALNVITLNAKHRALNMQKAVDMKLVKAKATSLGGYQGYCITMNLKNLTADSLVVLVEAGRRLNSTEDKFQDILIIKEELITLKKFEERNFKVKGYCCQASNCAPQLHAAYDINKLADSNLVTLARHLNHNCYNQSVEQHAIWAISDKKPSATVSDLSDSLLLPLRQLVSAIKGEELPWYSLVTKTYVYSNGVICNYPVLMKGKISYTNDTDGYATLYVLNEKGQQVCMVKSEWIKQGANQDYPINLPVKGLAKGKYTLALATPLKQLASREFEI